MDNKKPNSGLNRYNQLKKMVKQPDKAFDSLKKLKEINDRFNPPPKKKGN